MVFRGLLGAGERTKDQPLSRLQREGVDAAVTALDSGEASRVLSTLQGLSS